jgi:hypothetical protein
VTGLRPATVALFLVLAALAAPGAALGQGDEVKLALRPVGQAGPYFDLTMRPGETRSLDVEISNAGQSAISARTYASDVYTIINGGFGGRLHDEAQTGTTRWLDYSTDVLELQAGEGIARPFSVAVPADAAPGEYVTSLVLENDRPVGSGGSVVFNQIVRQAVAVVVTVPGQRSPALVIGNSTHKVVAGMSIVAVAVANTGNVRLKPVVGFTLFDAAGARVSQASVQMDTFYARTDTFVEVPLAVLLNPGTYTVRLSLDDAAQGAETSRGAIPLVVTGAESDSSAVPAVATVNKVTGDGQMSLPVWGVVLVAGLLLGGLAMGFIVAMLRRRRQSRISER